jgi:methyl-accepting chemotaxis protein
VVRRIREDIGSVAAAMHATERETETGAQLIQATGAFLATIFALIDQQADAINTSKQVILDMLTSLNRMPQSMRQIFQATQQSNTSIHIVAQNMEQLTGLAEQLRRSVEVFHVKEQDASHTPSSVISGAFHRGNIANNLPT